MLVCQYVSACKRRRRRSTILSLLFVLLHQTARAARPVLYAHDEEIERGSHRHYRPLDDDHFSSHHRRGPILRSLGSGSGGQRRHRRHFESDLRSAREAAAIDALLRLNNSARCVCVCPTLRQLRNFPSVCALRSIRDARPDVCRRNLVI